MINLDRSVERWNNISGSARQLGIELTRIPAIDGVAVPPAEWQGFDLPAFRRANGREALSGEYGCYRSHVAALQQFLNDGSTSAVILEDDAVLNGKLPPCLLALEARFADRAVLVRLVVHRMTGFEQLESIPVNASGSLQLGQCWFGPNGSAAAYWLTRAAAENLIKAALPGRMPFDMVLERPWEHHTPSLMFRPSILEIPKPLFSEIGSTRVPGAINKYQWYKRSGALLFRSVQLVRRLVHSAKQRRLPG